MVKSTTLPSPNQIGDKVKFDFGKFGHLKDAEITKVHFEAEDKVLYDVVLKGKGLYAKIYNIPSEFVV